MCDLNGATLQILTDGFAPNEAAWKLQNILDVCNKSNSKEIIVPEAKEWENLLRMREFALALRTRSYAPGMVDPPVSNSLML